MRRVAALGRTAQVLCLSAAIGVCNGFIVVPPAAGQGGIGQRSAVAAVAASRPAMQLREDHEFRRNACRGTLGVSPGRGWGVFAHRRPVPRGSQAPRGMAQTESATLSRVGAAKLPEFVLYKERWLMLGIVSFLALLSDWACFAAVGGTKTWVNAFHKSPEDLIDIFLFSNVFACFLYTDLTRRFGLKNVITVASGLMAVGCALRSGIHPTNLLAASPLIDFDKYDWSLPGYDFEILGTIFIGMAQPFFQCAPPLLSATWFGNKERSLSTAICLNANQLGIATAFAVGAVMLNGKAPEAMDEYLSIITVFASSAFIATVALFKERPPTPPTGSAAAHILAEDKRKKAIAAGGPDPWITYPQTAWELLRTRGFAAPTLAFVGSIGVTNAVSAFTSETMHRAGFMRETVIDGLGAGFQVAVMVGGIVLGGYVDRSKEFKRVTLGCFAVTLAALGFLGIAEGYDLNLPQWAVVGGLLTLGAAAGPVQPINAELAVEVSYPSDENAVEATQQLCGNLFSALLVPVCVAAAQQDFKVFEGVGPNTDIRGDTLVLMALVLGVSGFFTTFNAPLKRAELDAADVELAGDYMAHGGYDKVLKLWRKAAIFESFSAAYDETETLYREAADLFASLDLNKDGKICRAEFIAGFPKLAEEEVDELIQEADLDGDGNIDMEELWAVIQSVAAEEKNFRSEMSEV